MCLHSEVHRRGNKGAMYIRRAQFAKSGSMPMQVYNKLPNSTELKFISTTELNLAIHLRPGRIRMPLHESSCALSLRGPTPASIEASRQITNIRTQDYFVGLNSSQDFSQAALQLAEVSSIECLGSDFPFQHRRFASRSVLFHFELCCTDGAPAGTCE